MMRYPYTAAEFGQLAVVAVIYVVLGVLIVRSLRRRHRERLAALRLLRQHTVTHVMLYGAPLVVDPEVLPSLRCVALRRDLEAAIETKRQQLTRPPIQPHPQP